MTENEKRLKIVQKKGYEEQLSEAEKGITSKIFGMGASAVGMASLFTLTGIMTSMDPQSYIPLLSMLGGFTSLGVNIYAVKGLIESVVSKAIAQDRIKTIEAELSLEMEEERDMSR